MHCCSTCGSADTVGNQLLQFCADCGALSVIGSPFTMSAWMVLLAVAIGLIAGRRRLHVTRRGGIAPVAPATLNPATS